MREPIQIPVGHGFDRAYWLSRCEGFLVEDAAGMRIGTVVELHDHSGSTSRTSWRFAPAALASGY
jgi:hypothetical protein